VRVGPERRWVEWLVGCRGWVALVGPIFVVNGTIVTKKKIAIVPFLSLGLLPGTATHAILSLCLSFCHLSPHQLQNKAKQSLQPLCYR